MGGIALLSVTRLSRELAYFSPSSWLSTISTNSDRAGFIDTSDAPSARKAREQLSQILHVSERSTGIKLFPTAFHMQYSALGCPACDCGSPLE